MIDRNMVRLIESHEKELAQGLIAKLKISDRCSDFMRLNRQELDSRVLQIYRDLSGWLMNRSDSELEVIYKRLGKRRCEQGVRFDHLLWAFALTKEHLWDFVSEQGLAQSEVSLYGELEILRLVEQFFDRALFYMAVGYREILSVSGAARIA